MAEPLLGRGQLIVHRVADAELLQLVGATPGPAGTSTIEFEGVTLDLDGAHPGQVCALSLTDVVESGDLLGREPLMRRLLGAERVAELRQFVDSGSDRPHRLTGGRSTTRDMRGEVRRDVSLLAVAITQMNLPGLLPLERELGVLEATGLAQRAGLLADLAWLRSEFAAAVDLIVATDADELRRVAGVGGITAGDVLSEAAPLADGDLRQRQLRSLAELVEQEELEHDVDASWAMAMAMPVDLELASGIGGAVPFRPRRPRLGDSVDAVESPNSLPRLVGGPKLELHEGSGHELVARLAGWGERADGWWLRAFHGDEQVPIAVVPFQPNDSSDAIATFLAAPSYRDSLQVDVVDDPSQLRMPPDVGAFQRAIADGQRAARYERVGDRTKARQAWNDCSTWHERAGDLTRSKHAHAIADEQEMGSLARTGNSLRPLLTDGPLSNPDVTR